jgi:hypothetical protein
MFFKRLISAANLLFVLVAITSAQSAEINIDHTCINCSRKVNDSINAFHRRPIRVNQVGYLPEEVKKIAFVAAADSDTFRVLDTNGQIAYTGKLQTVGTYVQAKTSSAGYNNAVTPDYTFESPSGNLENLYSADFGGLTTQGRYRIVHATDTSASFLIHPVIYNKVLEKVLFFFGANRCGNTHSWIHEACHLKDGSALGTAYAGKLAGGWHDCGDHGKYAPTTAYTAMVLSLAYSLWPEKAPDLYGASYSQKTPDGIPDLLGEAKIGADYIYNLYAVSKELGLLDSADMFHSVGQGPGMDYLYWDVPEKQDEVALNLGGPNRPVNRKIGSDVAGSYVASLAFFSHAWKKQDSVYAAKLEKAAIDIYDNIVMKRLSSSTQMPCCYAGGVQTKDDEAMAAFALWFATRDSRFGYDLLENKSLGNNVYATFTQGLFPTGFLARGTNSFFHPGGWPTDFDNIHVFVLYGLAKLILPDAATAMNYGVSSAIRDSLLEDVQTCLGHSIQTGSNGSNSTAFPGMHVDEPYHGLFTSVDWGYNRYNLGLVTETFMYYDLTKSPKYREVGLDNLNYLLGANPYDISFINGCGDRNLQHPHNRAANPDGYNQSGQPYAYKTLTGAVTGGIKPGKTLQDEWSNSTSTETCIDFAAQAIFPLMIMSQGETNTVAIGIKSKNQTRIPRTKQRMKPFEVTGRKTVTRKR